MKQFDPIKAREEFEELQRLVTREKFPAPTDAEIGSVIEKIEARLAVKAMNRDCNFAVKEGYLKALDILRDRLTDIAAVASLSTIQGRAVAYLAIDYQLGKCDEETLIGVPIKTR